MSRRSPKPCATKEPTKWQREAQLDIEPVRLRLQAALKRGRVGLMGLPHTPTLGNQVGLCLLVDFDDVTKGSGEMGNYLLRDAIALLKEQPKFDTEIKPQLAGLTTNAADEVVACNVFFAGENSGVWAHGLWPNSFALVIVGPQELWPGGPKVNRYQITNIGSDFSLDAGPSQSNSAM